MMTRRELLLLGITSATAPLGLLTQGRASRAAGPNKGAGGGTIYVYAWSGGDGRSEIVQGTFALDPERLTWTRVADQSESEAYDTDFRISRNGRFLALERWARKRADRDDIDVVGVSIRDLARRGEIRKLSGLGGNPIWSPDDQRLLIAVGTGNVPGTMIPKHVTWLVNADGSEPTKLPIPDTEQVDDWSPDGSWLLTCSHRDQDVGYQVYRMRLDGSDARRLTASGKGVLNLDGRISPNGRQIAYWRTGDRQSGIWVMDADGSNPRRILEATADAIPGGPSWSPDGQRLVISVHAERRHERGYLEMVNHKVVILDLAGSAPVTVAPPLAAGLGNPQWAPSWKS
jgi:hypothetical protein